MTTRVMKYNPSFLEDEELIRAFVVRNKELEMILEIIRENNHSSNQHILVIGPRGSGKTTLVRRVTVEIRHSNLVSQWYPVVFGEESYQVSTPGEFWLEALFHIGEQTNNDRWRRAYKELLEEKNEDRLRDRVIAQLMDFADEQKKKLLLIVENLNMILGDQLTDKDAWVLRHTFMNEPRIMMLCTATSRFEKVDNYGQAFYDLFKTVELRPLSDKDCAKMWKMYTGIEPPLNHIRPIKILTGGNPRLIHIVSTFSNNLSLRDLIEKLTYLIDENTEYFKSHLESLSPQERKVFVALADLWDPSSAREIAKYSRLEVNKTSTVLGRLVERGAVVAEQKGRKKLYYVAERMYNIYHLMRRRSQASDRLRAVIHFMINFYDSEQLIEATKTLTKDVYSTTEFSSRQDYFAVCELLLKSTANAKVRKEILNTVISIQDLPDVPVTLKETINTILLQNAYPLIGKEIKKWSGINPASDKAVNLIKKYEEKVQQFPQKVENWTLLAIAVYLFSNDYERAYSFFKKAIEINPGNLIAYLFISKVAKTLNKPNEFEEFLNRLLDQYPKSIEALTILAHMYNQIGLREREETIYEEILTLDPNNEKALLSRAESLLKKNKDLDKALETAQSVVNNNPQSEEGWELISKVQLEVHDLKFATQALENVVAINPLREAVWLKLANLYEETVGDEQALQLFQRALNYLPNSSTLLEFYGRLLIKMNNFLQAEEVLMRVINLRVEGGTDTLLMGGLALRLLGDLYEKTERYEQAIDAYKRASDADPAYPWGWLNLGLLFAGRDPSKAVDYYKKALESIQLLRQKMEDLKLFDSLDIMRRIECLGYIGLFNVLLATGDSFEALHFAQNFLSVADTTTSELLEFASIAAESTDRRVLEQSKAWLLQALELDPENSDLLYLTSHVLIRLNEWEMGWQYSTSYIMHAKPNDEFVEETLSIFIPLVAVGYAIQVLELIKSSRFTRELEPFIVGLQLYIGEEIEVPVEIIEIGQDVVKRIKEEKEQLHRLM